MTKYKDLVGTAVQEIAGDDGVVAGQLWYNTTENEYKYLRQFAGNAWSSGGNLNTARYTLAGAGTQTDNIVFGGSPEPAGVALTEKWDGSSWTEIGDLNSARTYIMGAGTSSSALGYAGLVGPSYKTLTESWNGSSWSEVADLSTARFDAGDAGSAVSALVYGGSVPGGKTAATEEFTAADFEIKTVTTS